MSTPRNTSAPPAGTHRGLRAAVRAFAPALALATAGLAVACADGPTSPTAAPSSTVSAAKQVHITGRGPTNIDSANPPITVDPVSALRWLAPVEKASVSGVIGPTGGRLTLDGGLSLVVPAGAVSTNTTFAITRRAGRVIEYEFEPHGTTFAVPLTIEQSVGGTALAQLPLGAKVRGAYVADPATIDDATETARVNEYVPTEMSFDGNTVRLQVGHFSGYLVSWGK